ncbi:MAG: MATE family efflux transporter [Eubacteriales bacterium]|nr:MATE family efflux transporter [Eubacteriales bacterium]MDD3881166.1 MATE family efflux transporter [Eubacteriales bacterium]MDD4511548.1 MATE family efflux transporter [Eubacteriales bacterium]
MGKLKNFFLPEGMVKANDRLGELPSAKETYGDVYKIALPSVLEMVLQSLIGSVDTMMVGTLGSAAISAVGLTGQPRMLLLAIFFAMNIGVTAIVARRKGQGLQKEANQTLRNALLLLAGISVVAVAVGVGFSRQLMLLAGAKSDTVDMASDYFTIIAWGLPINALTMCICAAQRGIGKTKITMQVNVTGNVVNVIFNYLLIGGHLGFPALGVRGAAIATVIGYAVGGVMALLSVLGSRSNGSFLHLSRHDSWKPDKQTLSAIGKVGGNAMIEQVALRVGFFLYARIVADLGTMPFASHQICMQFLNLTFSIGDGIGAAGTSLVGQMLGRKRPDLSQLYGKAAQRIAFVVSVLLLGLLIVLRYPLVGLFSNEADVIALSAQVMIIVALFQPMQTTSVVISGCLRGAGDTKYVARVMMLCVMVIRPVLAWGFIHVLGADLIGAWCASFIDMAVRMTLVYRRFSKGEWFKISV